MANGQPNHDLANLIEEAAISWACLAKRVNELAASEFGLALRYDYTAVHRWTKRGQQPKPFVRSLVARILTERVGRRVTVADIGMTDEESLAARALRYQPDTLATVDTVLELGRADVKRRGVIAAPFVLVALAAPSRDWLLATLDATVDDRGPCKVDMKQVASIREMFALFQEMDVMHGGGHARVALVEYMNSYVLPLVKRRHGQAIQRALYEAASEQAYLVGWMAYDDGQHGLAQRYLIQSLRLAEASGNAVLGAHVLAGMSDQANLLGNPQEALMLARAGQRGITADDSAACLADLQILEARALGALGAHRETAIVVARAERTFQRVSHENEPEWARFIDKAYLFGEAANCFRDVQDTTQIDRFAGESSAEAKRQRRARRGALSHAALAISLIHQKHPEAAAAKGIEVVELAASVNSSRCLETVRDLKRQLKPFGALPQVQAFNAHALQELGLPI